MEFFSQMLAWKNPFPSRISILIRLPKKAATATGDFCKIASSAKRYCDKLALVEEFILEMRTLVNYDATRWAHFTGTKNKRS